MKHQPYAEPIELVAIDLDGTLLRSDKQISPRVADAVAQVVDRGIDVVLASARPPRGVRAFHETLGLQSLQVNYNGALIHDRQRSHHVRHLALTAEVARQVVRLARVVDPQVVVHIERLDQWLTDRVDDTLTVETASMAPPDFIGPLDEALQQDVTKVMLLAEPDRLEKVRAALTHRFTGQIALAISDPQPT